MERESSQFYLCFAWPVVVALCKCGLCRGMQLGTRTRDGGCRLRAVRRDAEQFIKMCLSGILLSTEHSEETTGRQYTPVPDDSLGRSTPVRS
ncbi:hypothetical protein CC85DRAFT_284874 [Cutaneotrichosporon oleaginosum]|uniref:Secreted protein n=1 Tax=Cutaneotrichosporon oleaginosum TaxID=879819 RepID=A0A0J0XPS7_9TREE|nr:uncharacterized protein CC85DRAFT_284874 [Cutaneotrichosporon oleaginosum]KLT43120.1 hypothetical protein CC85DRAFT_284874 [Cutaneotrichosporon oleaginosum]TXT10047.1 hypothetical protein COLE_03981 [Cutaneotrichosporon oleaginosum]